MDGVLEGFFLKSVPVGRVFDGMVSLEIWAVEYVDAEGE